MPLSPALAHWLACGPSLFRHTTNSPKRSDGRVKPRAVRLRETGCLQRSIRNQRSPWPGLARPSTSSWALAISAAKAWMPGTSPGKGYYSCIAAHTVRSYIVPIAQPDSCESSPAMTKRKLHLTRPRAFPAGAAHRHRAGGRRPNGRAGFRAAWEPHAGNAPLRRGNGCGNGSPAAG